MSNEKTQEKDIATRKSKSQEMRENRRRVVRPRGDIWEESDSVVLQLEMPGVSKDGIEVTVEGDSLIIYGHRSAYADDVSYLVHERYDADYRAVYTLDERIDREQINAAMESGVLTMTLQLKAEVKPRKIEVTVG